MANPDLVEAERALRQRESKNQSIVAQKDPPYCDLGEDHCLQGGGIVIHCDGVGYTLLPVMPRTMLTTLWHCSCDAEVHALCACTCVCACKERFSEERFNDALDFTNITHAFE